MRPQLAFRKIHRWLGLILGLQIMLWFASGFMMSFMPIDEVRGAHLYKPETPSEITVDGIDLTKLPAQVKPKVLSVELKSLLGKTVVAVQTLQQNHLFLPPEMIPLAPLDASQVQRIINNKLLQPQENIFIERLAQVPNEARGRTAPLWKATLNDAENTRIYVSEQSREIVATRTDRWRWFDFLWMLHIMDYDDRSDFNHPLLYLTAFFALLFSITGMVLLYFSMRNAKHRK